MDLVDKLRPGGAPATALRIGNRVEFHGMARQGAQYNGLLVTVRCVLDDERFGVEHAGRILSVSSQNLRFVDKGTAVDDTKTWPSAEELSMQQEKRLANEKARNERYKQQEAQLEEWFGRWWGCPSTVCRIRAEDISDRSETMSLAGKLVTSDFRESILERRESKMSAYDVDADQASAAVASPSESEGTKTVDRRNTQKKEPHQQDKKKRQQKQHQEPKKQVRQMKRQEEKVHLAQSISTQNSDDDREKEQANGSARVGDDSGITTVEGCLPFVTTTSCRAACSFMGHMASNMVQLPFWLQLPFFLSFLPLQGNPFGLVTMAMVLVLIGGTCLSTSRHRKDGSGCRPFEQNETHDHTRSRAHDNHDAKKKKKFIWRRQAGTDHARLKAVEDLTRMWNCKSHDFEHAIDVMARIIECKYISPAEFSGSPLVSEIRCTLQKYEHGTKMGKTTRINGTSMLKRVGEFFDVVSNVIVRSPWTRGKSCVARDKFLSQPRHSKNSWPEDIPGGSTVNQFGWHGSTRPAAILSGPNVQEVETQRQNFRMTRKSPKSARAQGRGFREEEERVKLGNIRLLWVPCVFLVVAVAMLLVSSLTPTVARARASLHSSMPALTRAPTVTFTGSASAGLVTYAKACASRLIRVPQSRVVSQLTSAAGAVVVIFGIDDKGLVNEWNNKTAEITGFRKDAVVGQSLVNEKSKKPVTDHALEGKEEVNFGFPLFTKDQKYMEVLLQQTTTRDVGGNVVGAIGGGQDVTKRRQVQMEMIRMVKHLNSFIDTENARISGIDASEQSVLCTALLYTHTRARAHTHTHTHTGTPAERQKHARMNAHTHTHIHTYTRTHIHVHTHSRSCVQIALAHVRTCLTDPL